MLQSCKAIILRIVRYNDKADIIDTYTNLGRLSFAVAKSQSRKKSHVRQLCHPLSVMNIVAEINPKSTIQKIKEASPAFIQKTIPFNPVKQSISFFLAETLSHILQEDNEDEQTFYYIYKSIEWLDNSPKGYANFHLIFLIRISHLLGLKPDISIYRKGDIFDLQNAVFGLSRPSHGNYLNEEDTESLYQLMRLRYETMHLFKMNKTERNKCLDLIMRYYSLHITDLSKIKSLEVLKELFT